MEHSSQFDRNLQVQKADLGILRALRAERRACDAQPRGLGSASPGEAGGAEEVGVMAGATTPMEMMYFKA